MIAWLEQKGERVLSHWAWAVPVLLIMAMLTIPKVDLRPPSGDEFYSMFVSGWLADDPASPLEILETIATYFPDQTPAFYFLLSFWGNLTGVELATGRILVILLALLSFAMAYRIARDFVAPIAGIMMLVVLSSNAYFGFFVSQFRMYTAIVLLPAIVLWLYLRIAYQLRTVKTKDYLLLGLSIVALVYTQAISAYFLIVLGSYHALFAPKNRRWFKVSGVVILAVLLFIPLLPEIIPAVRIRSAVIQDDLLNGAEAVSSWLMLMLNGQPLLLLVSLSGLLAGAWSRKSPLHPWLFFCLLYLPLLAILAQFLSWVQEIDMRHHLIGWLPFTLLLVAGIYGWYCVRKWAALLLVVWLLAGMTFHENTHWWRYIEIRSSQYEHPPTQVITRLALRAEPTPAILGYGLSTFYRAYLEWDGTIWFPQSMDYSQGEYFYGRHGIRYHAARNLSEFADQAERFAVTEPILWVYHQAALVSEDERAAAESLVEDLFYERCGRIDLGVDTVLMQYAWASLGCLEPEAQLEYETDAIMYELYGAKLNADGGKLYFSDRWRATSEENIEHLQMSYQLLTPDWDNVAQLDLPLIHPDELRMFYLDVANVPPGEYRLMLVVYDQLTGERLDWQGNPGFVPAMLQLSEVALP